MMGRVMTRASAALVSPTSFFFIYPDHHGSGATTTSSTTTIAAKAEHECGSPMAHYRYTCGKTHGYGNSRIRVTCHHRLTWIWVLVWVLQVLATSTREFVIYLFILI